MTTKTHSDTVFRLVCDSMWVLFFIHFTTVAQASGSGIDAFKAFFTNTPSIRNCVARIMYPGTNSWYVFIAYQKGNFVTRREKAYKALSRHKFSQYTWMAARDNSDYWGFYGWPDWAIDFLDASPQSYPVTTNKAYALTQQGFMFGVVSAAVGGLDCLFLGIPVWDPLSTSWSNNTLTAIGPYHSIVTARILATSNNCPLKLVVDFKGNTQPLFGLVPRSRRHLLTYYYGATPINRRYPFIPRAIEITDGTGENPTIIDFLRFRTSNSSLPSTTWGYQEYLNAAVHAIHFVTNGVVRFVDYDDNKEGYSRILGVRIPNRYFFALCFSAIAIFTALLFVISKLIWAPGPVTTQNNKQKE